MWQLFSQELALVNRGTVNRLIHIVDLINHVAHNDLICV